MCTVFSRNFFEIVIKNHKDNDNTTGKMKDITHRYLLRYIKKRTKDPENLEGFWAQKKISSRTANEERTPRVTFCRAGGLLLSSRHTDLS